MIVCVETLKERLTIGMKRAIFALMAIIWSTQAGAEGIRHKFIVQVGPFDAARTELEFNLNAQDFSVISKVKTNGLFDLVYPFSAQYSSLGKILADETLLTQKYASDSQSSRTHRTKELFYNNQGLPIYRLSAKNNKKKRVDIPQEPQNLGTTDLQTAIAQIAFQYRNVGFCQARLEIFDGKRRFAAVFQDNGNEHLTANEYSSLTGQAHKCLFYIDKLDNDDDDLIWQISQENPINLWIMQDKQTKLPYIARIHMNNTPLGELNAYTTHISLTD